MSKDKMIDAVSQIDEKLIETYFETEQKLQQKEKERQKPMKKQLLWKKWGLAAACLVLIAAGAFAIPRLQNRTNPVVGYLNRPYKNTTIVAGETSVIWPWEYKTIYEKYVTFQLDGLTFVGNGKEIDQENIGAMLGSYTISGYNDPYEAPAGGCEDVFDVYEIKNVSSKRILAVQMDGKYYGFRSDLYAPPATWGEVMEEYGLPTDIHLERFTKKRVGAEDEFFRLTDNAYIWEVLRSCSAAPFTDPLGWHETKRDYISLPLTSAVLGVYKNVLYITEDGYLWTNAFYGEYLYEIGKEAAEKIIAYALEHSEAAAFEPYRKSIVGTVTEITKDYIMVDDTVLCKNPEDGIGFKVLLQDIRISRYVDLGIVNAGDLIQVTYEGEIRQENGYIIDHAISMAEAILADGNVLIPE